MATATKNTVQVRVSAMRKGDVLNGTGETVEWSYRGVKTPKGESEVRLINADGTHRDARWKSGSKIWVVR